MDLRQSARISLLADLIERRVRRFGADTGFAVHLEWVTGETSFMQIVVHQPAGYAPVSGRIELGPTPWGQCNHRGVAAELMTRRAVAVGAAEGMRDVRWLAFWNP